MSRNAYLPDHRRIFPPVVVDTPETLSSLQRALDSVSRLAVDTESNSLYAYQEQVCLIQLSTDWADYLVDPLHLDDAYSLGFLGAVFANPAVEKVLHAAEYDVMCLRRDFGFTFSNLFDTMLAARVLGWEHFGLGAVLEERFGVKVNKRHQRANWGKRPLPPKLLRYAQLDTHYLLPLRDELYSLLEAGGHLDEAREIFDEVCSAEWNRPDFDPEGFWRIGGARKLSLEDAAILSELYLYREQQARRRDLPVFKVMSDNTLLCLATEKPKSLQAARRIPGMSESQTRRYGVGVLKAIQRGSEGPLPSPPSFNHRLPNELISRRFDALHAWRKERAAQRGISSDLVMPKDALWELAVVAPRTRKQLQTIQSLGPWRLKTYGEEILRVLVAVDNGQVLTD